MLRRVVWQGLVSGAVGATVMTLGEKIEQRFTGRPDSLVPARVLQRLTGAAERPADQSRAANWTMHLGQGALIGVLRSVGIDVSGPWPPDTMFTVKARTRYDAAICMYHDQALIPLKTLDMEHGVNVTLGLPIVRTSPDHGTGFDIAGKGAARDDSFRAALKLAWEMAERRSRP